MERNATVERDTLETSVKLSLNMDGAGNCNVDSGIGFFDHMLVQIAKHAFIDIELKAVGDLHVDSHHTVEDVGIVLGKALRDALGERIGVNRYGHAVIPMDEALALVALDFSGRGALVFDAAFSVPRLGDLDTEMIEEFFRAVCMNAGMSLHIKMLAGRNNHHICEAVFKAFAKALGQAVAYNPKVQGVPSSKGTLE